MLSESDNIKGSSECQTNEYKNEFSNLVVMTVMYYMGNLILVWKIEE